MKPPVFYPRVVQEAAQLHTLVGLVSCGFGVALVPESIAGSALGDKVVFRPIRPLAESANPGIGLYMSWHAHNPSPLVSSFVSLFNISNVQAG